MNEDLKIAGGDWCGETFANTTKVQLRWYLLRKEPGTGSREKADEEQVALLPNGKGGSVHL